MSTLIIEGNSDGQRRCDSRCHDATTPECDCVCGGRYHGKGSGTQALEEAVEEFGREMLTSMEAEGHDCGGLRVALGMTPPRCQAKYKTANRFVTRGAQCQSDAVMEVKLETVNNPILFCARHYGQWCDELLSKRVKWSAHDIVRPAAQTGAGADGVA